MNFTLALMFSSFEISALIIPIAAFVLCGVIAVCSMYFHHQRRRLWHETARLALEKGQPLPPRPFDLARATFQERTPSNSHRTDIRSGLILVATGAGIYVFLGTFLGKGFGYIGAIPGFIGVSLLLHGVLCLAFPEKTSAPEDQRPNS
jgi:hypothetical protein